MCWVPEFALLTQLKGGTTMKLQDMKWETEFGISLSCGIMLHALVLAMVESLHDYSFYCVSPPSWFKLSLVSVILCLLSPSVLWLVMTFSYDLSLDVSTFPVVSHKPTHISVSSPLLKFHWIIWVEFCSLLEPWMIHFFIRNCYKITMHLKSRYEWLYYWYRDGNSDRKWGFFPDLSLGS